MYFCYSCLKKTQIVNKIYVCLNCGSETIEKIPQNVPQNSQSPVSIRYTILTQTNNIDPTQVLLSMISLTLPRFQLESSNVVMGPIITRIFILNGGHQEEKNPVPEQIIQKLQKSQVYDCSVCQENGGIGVKLPCKHTFHENCIKPWFKQKNTCPCCRNKVSN